MSFLLLLLASLCPQAQSTTTPDAELWTAAIEQVQRDLRSQGGSGELVILNQTIPTSELHVVRDSSHETHLLDLLRQRNTSARESQFSGVRLPPRVRMVEASSVKSPDFLKQFPTGSKLVRFSLPAFSQDGNRAILYFSATGGFDDSQGAYLVFEKKQEEWIAIGAFGMWVT